MESNMRRTGIDVIGDVPWGTHFCQFYETSQDLIEILVPYFKEGLAANEFCMWVTSEPLQVDQATAALRSAVPDLDDYIDKGQIEILDYSQWYIRSGKFSEDEVLHGWIDKLKTAQERGYEGLRLTGNTFWLEKADWDDFTRYEEMVNDVIGQYPMLAVCTYSLQKCNAVELLDVVANHQFALIKRSSHWEIIESTQHKNVEQTLRESEEKLSALYTSMVEGGALHEIIYDRLKENPVDYIITSVNPSYEKITGFSRDKALGQKASELYGIDEPPYLDVYARVVSSGKPESFETYFPPMKKHFSISVFSPARGKFATVFSDITERKRAEQELGAAKDRMASDLDAMARLHKISTKFVSQGDIRTMLDEIVETAIAITHADMGNIQLFDAKSGSLKIMAHHGFKQPFLNYWNMVHKGQGTCGTALGRGERVIIDDVTESPIFVGTPALQVQLDAGVRAVQSTPLLSRSGDLLGMLSTHYRTPRRPEVQDLQRLDLLARLTADIIERTQAEVALEETNEELEVAAEELRQQNDELIRTQSKLQESEERFRTLAENIPDQITRFDRNLRLLYANPAVLQRTGLPGETFAGRTASEYGASPTASALWEKVASKVLESGEPRRYEHTSLWQGETRILDVQMVPERDADGTVRAVIAIARDITERKRAEEALRKSEEKYRTIVETANEGIWTVDAQLITTFVNEKMSEMLGYDPHEIIGMSAFNFMDEEGKALANKRLERRVQGIKGSYEHKYLRKDGSPVWTIANVTPLQNSEGKFAGSIGLLTDITERKRAEEERQRLTNELSDRVAEMQAVLEVAPIAIWIAHDPQCLRITGNSYADELIMQVPRGSNISASARPGDAVVTFRVFHDGVEMKPEELPAQVAAATGKSVEAELLDLVFSDGRVVSLIEGAVPLFDAEGHIRGSVATGMDVTLLKQAEEDLRKSRDELEQGVLERTADLSQAKEDLEVINEELQVELEEHQKLEVELVKAKDAAESAVEAKAAFLANMSHELRTPMNAVIGFSNLLLDESLTPDQKDYIERIRSGGEVLLGLINDVLDFSKVEKNKVELDHHPLSLRGLAEESLIMVAVQANDKRLNLSHTISYGTPDTIIGDHGRLRQILVNLLSNAVKFTDVGEISLSISSKAKEGNKHQILFSVRDTGIGIPEDKIDMLFQPFSQVEASMSSQRGGTGLGLVISKRLVELMGGEVWAESEPGKGSTFRFTIEAEIAQGELVNSGISQTTYENLAKQNPLRILVAEDVPSNQKVLVEMLKRMGYRADMAADGIEVFQALERQPYDLILMDIKMPEMDGIAAAKEIRRLWPNNRPKMVAITAYAMEGDREKCLEADMDDYIAKPVQKAELAEVLKRCAL